ncbi:hypothetical protein H5410_033503 [Solanum commersonii]|uniref:Uncharacterized protein n=1 Tax=Solanum commersonii TaxID=4109 RepID=A0A9J5YQD7_SOLCO|nr:hypothetical protein H5410_033503 [Solanum commersonii]
MTLEELGWRLVWSKAAVISPTIKFSPAVCECDNSVQLERRLGKKQRPIMNHLNAGNNRKTYDCDRNVQGGSISMHRVLCPMMEFIVQAACSVTACPKCAKETGHTPPQDLLKVEGLWETTFCSMIVMMMLNWLVDDDHVMSHKMSPLKSTSAHPICKNVSISEQFKLELFLSKAKHFVSLAHLIGTQASISALEFSPISRLLREDWTALKYIDLKAQLHNIDKYWSMKWLRTIKSRVQNPTEKKTLGDFFHAYVLVLVDKAIWYMLLVGGNRYPVELVEGLKGAQDSQSASKFERKLVPKQATKETTGGPFYCSGMATRGRTRLSMARVRVKIELLKQSVYVEYEGIPKYCKKLDHLMIKCRVMERKKQAEEKEEEFKNNKEQIATDNTTKQDHEDIHEAGIDDYKDDEEKETVNQGTRSSTINEKIPPSEIEQKKKAKLEKKMSKKISKVIVKPRSVQHTVKSKKRTILSENNDGTQDDGNTPKENNDNKEQVKQKKRDVEVVEQNENNQEMVRKDDNGEINEAEASTCGNSLQESAKEQENKTDDINGTNTFVDSTNKIQSSESLTSVSNRDKSNNKLVTALNAEQVSNHDKVGKIIKETTPQIEMRSSDEQIKNQEKRGRNRKHVEIQLEVTSPNRVTVMVPDEHIQTEMHYKEDVDNQGFSPVIKGKKQKQEV